MVYAETKPVLMIEWDEYCGACFFKPIQVKPASENAQKANQNQLR
jgi:hypothetical protein